MCAYTHTSHTHTHILGHKKYGKMHTRKHTASKHKHKNAGNQTHTHTVTQTHTHQCAHADARRHKCTDTRTHSPHRDARDNQTGAAAREAASLRSSVFFAAFASPRPPCLQDLIRFRPGGRGPTLFKITAVIPANCVKWNLRPLGNPLIQL